MSSPSVKVYQIIRNRPIRGAEARKRIQRELHGVVIETPVPKAERAYFYDLRRGRRHIYGSLLRFIEIAVSQGVSRTVLLRIPEWLNFFICDLCDERDGIAEDRQPPRAA